MRPPPVIVDGPTPNRHFADGGRLRVSTSRDTPDEGCRPVVADRVRLRRSHRRPQNSYTQVRQTLVNFLSEDAIAIMDDEAVGMIVRQRFPKLLQCPFRRGIGCDDVVETPAASDLHDDQDVQGAEGGGDHREEVAGHHDPGVVTDNGQPALFRVRRANWTVSMEVLADGAGGDLNGQLELQLVGDAFLSR